MGARAGGTRACAGGEDVVSFHLLIGERALLSGASPRIPAAQREAFREAHALLARAANEAEASTARVEAASVAGWREGWHAAIARAETEVGERVAAFADTLAAETQERRSEIAAAAMAAVEAMLGTLTPDDATLRLATAAVARIPEDERVIVHCAPAMAERIAAALTHRDVAVEPRDDFGPLQVALLTGNGRIVADLNVQLAQLADRWGVAR